MIRKLTVDEIIEIVKKTPEQCIFDWKRDFVFDKDNDKKSEFIKDVVAIANATTNSPGFIFYGIDGKVADVCGISKSMDDASLQQFIANKIDPQVKFIYYEVSFGAKIVGVAHIEPSFKRPHVVTCDFGKLREGQMFIREGSSTRGIRQKDLIECFYGETSPYFQDVLEKVGVRAQELQAQANYINQIREYKNEKVKEMEIISGLAPGSLGAKW